MTDTSSYSNLNTFEKLVYHTAKNPDIMDIFKPDKDHKYGLDYKISYRYIGHIDDIKNIDKDKEYSVGDILCDGRSVYVYTDNGEFVKLCASENETNSAPKMKPHPTNCENCGAVLRDYRCEYCGTEYPRY